MSYASLTKGFLGLAASSLTLAARNGILDVFLDELEATQPGLFKQAEKLPNNLAKSFRYVSGFCQC